MANPDAVVVSNATVLKTGWERDVPVSDTLIRAYMFHWAALCEAIATAGGGRALETDAIAMTDLRRPGGYFNGATILRPPTDWDTVADEVEEFFGDTGGEVMLWSAWPTPDLTTRGWRLSGHPPLLVRPPVSQIGTPSDDGVGVRPVRTPDDLAMWERVVIDGYPLPELQPPTPGAMVAPSLLDDDRFHFYLADPDGHPIAAAASFVACGIGSLAFGVTLPQARRRGHWRRLAIARLNSMSDMWATGVFSDDSRPGAERLGFVPLLRLTLWIRARPRQE
jgi:hypothetical protein